MMPASGRSIKRSSQFYTEIDFSDASQQKGTSANSSSRGSVFQFVVFQYLMQKLCTFNLNWYVPLFYSLWRSSGGTQKANRNGKSTKRRRRNASWFRDEVIKFYLHLKTVSLSASFDRKKILEQRQNVITELLVTEREYCRDLRLTCQVFQLQDSKYLESKGVDVNTLFGNIHEVNLRFYVGFCLSNYFSMPGHQTFRINHRSIEWMHARRSWSCCAFYWKLFRAERAGIPTNLRPVLYQPRQRTKLAWEGNW